MAKSDTIEKGGSVEAGLRAALETCQAELAKWSGHKAAIEAALEPVPAAVATEPEVAGEAEPGVPEVTAAEKPKGAWRSEWGTPKSEAPEAEPALVKVA